ncbi:MAG: T9SS type A sorting domain-containing protein [Flavipsychrobacter sp.]
MKKIYSLALIMLIAIGASAQRNINIEAKISKPTASTVIENGKSFDILVVVKNLGPDSLKMSDSLLMFWTLDGQSLPFAIGGQTGAAFNLWNRSIKSGDTIQLNYPGRTLSYSLSADQSRTMCVNIFPRFYGGGADSIIDASATNNRDCVTMTFKAGSPASIGQTAILEGSRNTASMYPNPATAQTNLAVKMNKGGEVSIKIIDITGRVVASQNLGYQATGEHNLPVDISTLAPGAYMYQAQLGDNMTSGKLSVTK